MRTEMSYVGSADLHRPCIVMSISESFFLAKMAWEDYSELDVSVSMQAKQSRKYSAKSVSILPA